MNKYQLQHELMRMSKKDLITLCRYFGVTHYGKKQELGWRLVGGAQDNITNLLSQIEHQPLGTGWRSKMRDCYVRVCIQENCRSHRFGWNTLKNLQIKYTIIKVQQLGEAAAAVKPTLLNWRRRKTTREYAVAVGPKISYDHYLLIHSTARQTAKLSIDSFEIKEGYNLYKIENLIIQGLEASWGAHHAPRGGYNSPVKLSDDVAGRYFTPSSPTKKNPPFLELNVHPDHSSPPVLLKLQFDPDTRLADVNDNKGMVNDLKGNFLVCHGSRCIFEPPTSS